MSAVSIEEEIAYLEKSIVDATDALKHHMSNVERACIVSDRKEMRERLAALKGSR